MFTPAFVAQLYPSGEPPALITHVDASGKGATSVGDLTSFKQLLRLNLDNNQLAEFGGLAASTTLKQLLLAGNRIAKLPKLDIPQLQARRLYENVLKVHMRHTEAWGSIDSIGAACMIH
jgi:hypothetical protein